MIVFLPETKSFAAARAAGRTGLGYQPYDTPLGTRPGRKWRPGPLDSPLVGAQRLVFGGSIARNRQIVYNAGVVCGRRPAADAEKATKKD
jgi:hypothetical protein